MVAALTPILHTLAFGVAVGFAGHAGPAWSDPTPPPDAFRSSRGSTPAAPAASRHSSQPVVILSSDRRQVTIDGQTVKIGGRIGDATVIRISDTEVVFRKAGRIETMKLYGTVEKKPVNSMSKMVKD